MCTCTRSCLALRVYSAVKSFILQKQTNKTKLNKTKPRRIKIKLNVKCIRRKETRKEKAKAQKGKTSVPRLI